ncbi:hypothetical protein ACFL7D_09665 [candidate division KSB1 bacterium]
MKKVKVEYNDGREVSYLDTRIIDRIDSLYVNISKYPESMSTDDFKSLKYSNTHLGTWGGLVGFIVALYQPKYLNYKDDEFPPLYGLALFPIGIYLGNKLGSKIFIKWKDYDLNSTRSSSFDPEFYSGNKMINVGIRIPIRK